MAAEIAADAVETPEADQPSASAEGLPAPTTPIAAFANKTKGNGKSPGKGSALKRPAAASPGKTPMKAALAKSKAKAKAKVKAVGKATAKPKTSSAKSKPKAKPKAKSSAAVKRPAAKEEDSQQGKKGSWAAPLVQKEPEKEEEQEGEEEEHATQDEAVEPSSAFELPDKGELDDDENTKNRSKNAKFLKMLKDSSLPDWLVQEWNKASKLTSGRREKQREIVNNCLDHRGGRLVLNVDKPMFHQMSASYQQTLTREKEKSLPRRLLQGMFNMSDEAFEQALLEGDVVPVQLADGKTQYSFQTMEHETERGKRTESSVKEQAEGDKKKKLFFEEGVKNWAIGLFEKSKDKAIGEKGPGLLALKDRQAPLSEAQWQQAQSQLKPAQDAFDKCHNSGLKFLQTIGPDNKEDPLYPTMFLGCIFISEKLFTLLVFTCGTCDS